MNLKTILLGGLVAAALVTAGLMLGGPPNVEPAEEATGLLFPDFDVNAAQSIEVAFQGGGYRFEREGQSWGLASKGGYPVDLGKLRPLLLAIDGAEIVDPKTADPANHARLGLQDEPEADDLHWRRLEINGANGDPLAALILGKRSGNGRLAQVFARRPGENQTWLISVNGLELPTADADWIDKQILKIGRDRVQAARVTHQDGEVLTVSKRDAKDAHYTFHELGDRNLRYVSAPDGLGSALEYLKLEDVARAEAMDFGDVQPTQVSIWTWDGVRLDIDVYAIEDTHWARLSATADPEGAPTLPTVTEEGATESGDETIAEASITPASRQADVDALNAKLSPWAFQLPAYNASSLTKRASDYVEAPPKPADEGEGESEFLAPGTNDATPVAPPDETADPAPLDDAEATPDDPHTADDDATSGESADDAESIPPTSDEDEDELPGDAQDSETP